MKEFKLNGETVIGFLGLVHSLVQSSKSYRVEIKEWRDKRTYSQNSLYWLWLNEISNQLEQRIGQQHDSDVMHEVMKQRFCPQKVVRIGTNGALITIVSTKKLDTGEMTHYLTQIEQWAIENGFRLTIPINSEYMELINRQNQ